MANFYTDNEDIQFLFGHMDLPRLAAILEDDFAYARQFDFAPADAVDAVDNYRRILTVLGELAGDVIAPTAEETDQLGNTLNPDGSVSRPPGIQLALKRLSQADLMGFTLPYRFGGLNFPNVVYTMSNDIISRADASLMNLYGLQGIAETINAFADETIKQQYLPRMASGELTGAMVLTEPDAGSDLQSVKTSGHDSSAEKPATVWQDGEGNWFVRGVKRFITNGCGDVLLVLARSEPEITDGRGLSLFLVERGPWVKVRRLENKLGIHGSPTCELFFNDAPAKLIGERQRGLITYVMSLMNGARIGIAAQGLGIGEAAYRVARGYAHSRKQFDTAIENFPAVRELLVDMSTDLQAARALTYHAAFCVDLEYGALRKLEFGNVTDAEKVKALRGDSRKYGRYNKLLTPMAKYYASEMSMRVSNSAMAVLGGSGYMKDYPVERHLRDSRITTIYEGTSQLQIVAAVAGVASGTGQTLVEELITRPWPEDIAPLIEQIRSGLSLLEKAVAAVKAQGTAYRNLYARKLVDIGVVLVIAAIFCDHATASDRKKAVARRWLADKMPEIRKNVEQITSGDLSVVEQFEALAGPVPVAE
ncbi:MAG: acyl-CoA dehydrogenase family protein [Phycisphaerae bacterium]|nr:acyl-CoA dehydrogenase family protein [Phycisphaerae bacterium]